MDFDSTFGGWEEEKLLLGSMKADTTQVHFSELLHRNVQRFRGGLVFKANRLLHHSTLGLRVIKKKKITTGVFQTFGGWEEEKLLLGSMKADTTQVFHCTTTSTATTVTTQLLYFHSGHVTSQ